MHARTLLPAAFSLALAAAAQQTAPPAFDVVSIKHAGDIQSNMILEGNAARSTLRPFRFTGDSVSAKVTLIGILTEVFQVKPFQIQGPDWMQQEVYEIEARMPDGTTRETARLMLQTMLVDRLGLKLRKEQKETAVYVLVSIPGTNKLEEVTPAPEGYGGHFGQSVDGRAYMEASPAMPLSALATALSGAAGRPVLDETGRSGYYKIKLQWTAEPLPPEGGVIRPGADSHMISALPQIGLKLEPAKRMLDHLVIENINKEPTAN